MGQDASTGATGTMRPKRKWVLLMAAFVAVTLLCQTSCVPTASPAERLVRAIEQGDAAEAKTLIATGAWSQKYDPPHAEIWYFPIHAAAMEAQDGILEDLLRAGADVNQLDYLDRTPVMWAVERSELGRERELLLCLKFLVDSGANLEAKTKQSGETALHMAAGYGDEVMVKELLSLGANIEARRTDGNTPLHEACASVRQESESAGVVQALLEAGADRAAKNNESKTPEDLALQKGRKMLVSLLQEAETKSPSTDASVGTRSPSIVVPK